MPSNSRARKFIALVVSTALVSLGMAMTPAAADPPDPAADGLRAAISGSLGYADFVGGLSGVGAFGEQVKGLTLVPGNDDALKLTDLMTGALAAAPNYATANSAAALATALNGVDADFAADAGPAKRHVKWAASASQPNGIDRLDITATVTRTVPTGIRLSTTTKPFDFTSDKGLKATLTFVTHFFVDFDATANTAWVEANPAITLDVNASVDKFEDVDAAIGILGVTLTNGTDASDPGKYNELAHLSAAVRDPNNDGRLTVGPNSELGASGASAGLTSAALLNPGGGTLDGRLHIIPKPSSVIANLPGATVDVTATAADLGASNPTADYPDDALAGVKAFETLTPFDLAQGVAQMIATLTKLQHTTPANSTVDVNLPFLHGTVADIVPATEALQAFLAHHVTPSTKPGLPSEVDFASIQSFLDKLAAETGGSIYKVTITDATYDDVDPTHPALKFTIGIHRDASAQSADPLADLLSGGPTGVTYNDKDIDTDKNWTDLGANDEATKAIIDGLKGRQISAGNSTAVIKSISGTTITLDPAPLSPNPPASLWSNGTPSNGADKPGYTISAGDPKTGNVELGNTLLAGAHLRDANATRPHGTITPGYDVSLPMVLDLQPAATGADCQSKFNAPSPCPYTANSGKNGTGPAYVVAELPLRADRIKLATGGNVLTATSKLATPVDILAPVGYVPVHVTGTVDFDPIGTDPLQSLTLKTPTGSTSPVALSTIFDTARDNADDVVTGRPNTGPVGHSKAAIKFDVVGDPTFFHADKSPGTTTVDADAPSAAAPSAPDTTGDQARLAVLDVKPGQNDALFGVLLADLGALSGQLQSSVTANGFDTKIPLVGTSFGQLLSDGEQHAGSTVTYTMSADNKYLLLKDTAQTFTNDRFKGRRIFVGSAQFAVNDVDPDHNNTLRLVTPPATLPAAGSAYRVGDELLWAVDALTAAPPTDLAVLLTDLQARLGNGSTVAYTVDATQPNPVMHLTVDWKRQFKTRAPAGMHFTLPVTKDVDLLGNSTTGVVDIDASGETVAKLNIPLTAAGVTDPVAGLTIDPSSSRQARAKVSTPAKALGASVGSLQIDLGDAGDDPGMSLKGDLAVLADAGAGAGLTLSDWASKLKPTKVNDGTTAQTCDNVSSTDDMALCASIPVHKKGDAATLDTMVVRLPKTATDLTGGLALSPDFGGGARLSPLPGLDGALQANNIAFGPLADGINKYFDTAKDALDLASAGGKVPLIGDDLQAGKDFLSDLQGKLNSGINGVTGYATFGDIESKLKGIFTADPLKDYVKGAATVQGECEGVPIPPPTNVNFTPTVAANATANTDYKYVVVALDVNGVATAKSAESPTKKNAAVLAPAVSHNVVTWNSSSHATSYKVYRSKAAAAFQFVGTKLATDPQPTTIDDTGQGDSSGPPSAGNPTYTGPCTANDSAAYVKSVSLQVPFGSHGNVDATNGCANVSDTDKCLEATLPLDLGLPGLSLHATKDPTDGTVSDAGIHAKLGWKLNLAVTIDKAKGVLLDTNESTQPELQVGAAIRVDDLDASLAFLNVKLHNADPASANQLAALFSVDLGCPGCDSAKQLPLSKLLSTDPSSLFTPNIQAKVAIHLDIDTSIDPSLPGITAKFNFDGDWNGATPDQFNITTLEFKDVAVSPGDFLKNSIKPIFDDIVNTLKPIQPIIDMITAPIPVLSDLSHLAGGGDVTIVTLAAAFGVGDGTVQSVIDVVKTVTKIASVLSSAAGSGISLGSFSLVKSKVKTTTVSPDVADALVDPAAQPASMVGSLNTKFGSGSDPKLSDAESGTGITFPALKHPRQLFSLFAGGDATLAQFDSGELKLGFDMSESFGPVYAPPPVMVVIAGGASVTLHVVAGFDTYGIRHAVETGKPDIQILDSLFFVTVDANGAPLPVISFSGYLAAGAEVSAVIIKVGILGGVQLTVNFTWNDPTNDGKFRFFEFLATALNNPICLFNVGGELSLFIKVYITIGFSPFSVSFDFTLIDIKLLDFSLKPDCTPPPPRLAGTLKDNDKVLYLFAGKLGDVNNGTRPRGDKAWDAKNADETWVVRQSGGTMTVQALGITQTFGDNDHPVDTVVLDGRDYTGKLKVLFQGKEKDAPFSAKAVIFGGTNDDVIKTGSGAAFIDGGNGADTITTADRPDVTKATNDANAATVAGSGGADHISVGNENDWVAGDGSISYSHPSTDLVSYEPNDTARTPVAVNGVAAVAIASLALDAGTIAGGNGSADADTVALGLGSDHAYGGGGNDSIALAADSPLVGTPAAANVDIKRLTSAGAYIVGNGGSDSVSGGSGGDTVYTGSEGTYDEDSTGAGDTYDAANPLDRTKSDVNTVDTGTGTDTVWGSNSTDFVTGHSKPGQVDTIYGLGGNDVLVGADGKDKVYGGRGDDYVVAQPSSVDTGANLKDQIGTGAYRITTLPDANPAVEKTLVGGGGKDRIYGGDGTSTIYGDHSTFDDNGTPKEDVCASPGPDRSDAPVEHPLNSSNESDSANFDDTDLILGGNGVDTVQAGGEADWVFTFKGDDKVCAEGGADHVFGGNNNDTVFGGSGDDVLQGDANIDNLYGNDDNDTVYGNGGTDLIEGNAGADTLFGGEDNDVILGGTTTKARNDAAATPAGETQARGDIIRGDIGEDTVIGDNGDPADAANGPVYDLASANASDGGPDLIYGGDDADHLYGGLDADTVLGGKANDTIEGNPGKDTIYGEDDADDIIGGSHQTPGDPAAKDAAGYPDTGDIISGGNADDVIAGDNATITDVANGDSVMKGRGLSGERHVVLFDLGYSPTAGTSGDDVIDGNDATDVVYGQGGVDTIHGNAGADYIEGGQAGDKLFGDAGQDDIAGGSSYAESGSGQSTAGQLDGSDTIRGGDDADVALGDNGLVTRDPAIPASDITKGRTNTDGVGTMVTRSIQPYDLGDAPKANTSDGDDIEGNNGSDAILGQGGNDRIKGNNDGDYAEGGPARDWIEGNAGDDDLVGGSSTVFGNDTGITTQGQPDDGDVVYGGSGDDVVLGDNAVTNRVGTPSPYLNRVGSAGVFETQRSLRLLDLSWSNGFLGAPTRAVFGGDLLSGGGGVDVMFGQDGDDKVSGGAADDYAEGNGGQDTMYGDRTLTEVGIALPSVTWPGSPSAAADLGDASAPYGQDDFIGGSSTAKFRDTIDFVHGDGGADFILGDNGTAVRDIVDSTTPPSAAKPVALGDDLSKVKLPLTNRVYLKRYSSAGIPVGAAFVRHGVSGASTRFCTTELTTCEPGLAAGADKLWGDAGSDTMYGQDGDDLMYGDTGASPIAKADDGGVDDHTQADDDDMYGELGADRMWGEAGDDAMVGDRGGIVDVFQTGSNKFVVDDSQVPQIHYEGFIAGTVTRQVDLQHDVNGDVFAAATTAAAMPHRGDLEGGNDRMRGGDAHDSIHAGWGDDLANGDSAGDIVFGDDGADVLWGGKGCDVAVDTVAASPDCYTNGVFDPAARGTNDRMVDYLHGGKGATTGPSVDPVSGALGSDIIDWHPRGTYTQPGTSSTCTDAAWPVSTGKGKAITSVDPCSWFEMTSTDDASVADNQHHQGIDWMYGGWDRDVLQGDVADNGPNLGDRMLDWTGAYNLYTHCNAAYGGFNDVRQWSPSMQSFLQKWGWSLGAGVADTDITTSGTSAYDELALVYQADLQVHGAGPAYPATPGHFDDPNACAP